MRLSKRLSEFLFLGAMAGAVRCREGNVVVLAERR